MNTRKQTAPIVVALGLLAVACPGIAHAQLDPILRKPSPNERQTQQNPAPKPHGDNQNRGRMTADYLWGVTNGNRFFDVSPYGRVGQETLDSPLLLDGWTYPYALDAAGRRTGQTAGRSMASLLYPSLDIDDEATTVVPPVVPGTPLDPDGRVAIGAAWSLAGFVGGPSTLFAGSGYHRAPVLPRPATSPTADPSSPIKFTWYPNVAGAAGTVVRYAIRVRIPQPAADASGENRIADARYVVHYQIPVAGGGFQHRSKICLLSQETGGVKFLVGDDGRPAYFPFASDATYATAGTYVNGGALGDPSRRARVELDATSEEEGANTFVVADSVEFVQRPQTVRTAPVIVPPHGGRKIDTTQVPTAANPYRQPNAGPIYAQDSFVNNPQDTIFNTSPIQVFDPTNVSTTYFGPISLIEPKAGGVDVAPIAARNHDAYKNSSGQRVPFFSHMQVLVARTEFVVDSETGVPEADRDGTRSRELGSVVALDWLTGVPVWRFPDRTYLPGGLRNPQVGVDASGRPFYAVPGIEAYDKDGNGSISEEEIYIGGYGNNPNGGVTGGITIAPNIGVLGRMSVPVRDANGVTTGLANATLGRYFRLDVTAPGGFRSVVMPVAFIACGNGVVYAIDPNGNNDNRYIENADTTVLGTYVPASTNLLWTFAPTSAPRVIAGPKAETIEMYNRRLKTEVPVPGPYVGSAPVIAWSAEEDDPTLNRRDTEPRLFVGNQNGVVYALDARAIAGFDPVTSTAVPFPFRKGEQTYNPDHLPHNAVTAADPYRTNLKWWFETLGSISSTAAVSATPSPRGPGAPVASSKGVYVTTGEGRVYCFDWDGPVTSANHDANMVWDGSQGDSLVAGSAPILPPPTRSAAALNDNIRFHNDVAALPTARPDFLEGTIRPRWTWPNRYRDIDALPTRLTDPIDGSAVYSGFKLAEPTSVGPIVSAPVLMDFPFLDPDQPTTLSGMRRYVVVATNDLNPDAPDSPRQGRLVLLDQIGDRRDFLSNPMPTRATAKVVAPAVPAPAANARIYAQAVDQFVSKSGPFGQAAPVWTFRNVYDTYTAGVPTISKRNAPTSASVDGEPARRVVPTIFVGGVGRVYALDLDEASGLLQRWRAPGTAQPTPLGAGAIVPGDESTGDRLNPNDPNNPANPLLNVGARDSEGLARKRILARTVPLFGDSSSIDGQMVVTGGPVQNRNNSTAQTAAALLTGKGAGQTTPPRVGLTGAPFAPSVPPVPTEDAPLLRSVAKVTATGVYLPFGYDLTRTLITDVVFPVIDLTGRYVNQDSDDPLATTRGSEPESGTPIPAGSSGLPKNQAYQYPTLFLTSADGYLHSISTNIEGEDPSLPTRVAGGGGEPTAALGWATTEDPERFNGLHTHMVSRFGPGGSGTGIAVVTNAYFPSKDPSYPSRRGNQRKNAADPSLEFRFYPPREPNSAAGTPDFGDQPRPGFTPRSVFGGPGSATNPVDRHTGLTGLPLDLNGLYYDKKYATLAGTMPNEAGKIRLPGYSSRGSLMTPTAFGDQYPESDSERAALNASLPPGSTPVVGSNVNPSGQNATWVYAGGDDGLFYAFTPVYTRRLGGQPSGFAGGSIVRRADPGQGQLKSDIFDLPDFLAMRAAAQTGSPLRPSRDVVRAGVPATGPFLSRAAQGKRNFFEFGEAIPIVVWDITVRSSYDAATPPASVPVIPPGFQITIRLTPRGGQTVTRTINLERAGGGPIATYPYDRSYSVPPTDTPAGHEPAQLGMAFFEFRIDGSAGLPVTPGTPIEVQVTAQPPVSVPNTDPRTAPQIIATVIGGAFENQVLDRRNPVFFVANPLAVQGYLVDTRTTASGAAPLGAAKTAGEPPANGIGPFHVGDAAKNLLSTASASLSDPDRSGAEYAQALGNGNTVNRFDPDPYLASAPGTVSRNPRFLQRLRDASGGDDPTYFFPVATSAGYVNHGQTGSTDVSSSQRNLRVVNRSLTTSLNRVRVEVMDDLIWRWWPGVIPNADAGTGNARLTPVGMGPDGRINPLPWETPVAEPQPWKRRALSAAAGTVLALGNISPDYPDIAAASASLQGQQAVSVRIGGSDAVLGSVNLPGVGTLDLAANPYPGFVVNPLSTVPENLAAAAAVRVPRYQPANLVAMHSLTSAYEAPSVEDGAEVLVGNGPVQLPRGIGNRRLQTWNGTGFSGGAAITPYGYTSRMRVFVDANGNGVWDSQNGEEPYRVVEVWMGVPVDMGLRSNETPVDLGSLPAGFGIQNGNLGYAGTISAAEQAGLAPPPLRDPYAPFFRPFTVQNTGNVNLWNLRASQKVEFPTTASPGTGGDFFLFGMRSETVDPRFGILSYGADPNNALGNVMPQVVTSLDKSYDAQWDQWYRTGSDPVLRNLMDYDLGGQTVYQRYYAPLAGRHTLHKARPGSTTPAVLGKPDLPSAQSLVPYGFVAPEPVKPMIGMAIPHGTPAGIYQSRLASRPGGPPMLSVFEDHDTDPANGYQAVPVLNADGTIAPAGPRYSGINGTDVDGNFRYPGVAPILPAGAETVLRARAVLRDAASNPVGYEYQPHTSPAIDVKVTVAETPITGQFPAFDLSQLAFTGLLPGIDPFPLIGADNRPASAIAPAAYRGANGRLNVYFSRNATEAGVALTGPGAPFRLFHTHMNWSETLGTFVAADFGSPVADPLANTGRWFTAPAEVTATGSPTETNTAPSVLQVAPGATNGLLLWQNSIAVPGAGPVDTLYYARLDANGVPASIEPWYRNPDPGLRRYGPRPVHDPAIATTFALFYGGGTGKWRLYYSPRQSDAFGVPVDAPSDGANRQPGEFPLDLPASLTSASEPSAVVRRLATVGNGNVPVVDVTFTGTLRTDRDPDIFMIRYAVTGAGKNARLRPLTLPLIRNERLVQEGRELVWHGRHVAWVRNLATPAFLPAIRIQRIDGTVVLTDPSRWQVDTATETLFQALPSGAGVLYVYVDTTTGTVRFRGAGEPGGRDSVYANYQPQAYRLTADGAPDNGSYSLVDNRPLVPGDGVQSGVVRRPAATPVSTGRLWTFWTKGAMPNRPAGLYFATRRVGIDLRSDAIQPAGRMSSTESLQLLPPGSPGASQVPAIGSLTVAGIGAVPYDVDYVNGRVYVDPVYEGLDVTVQYTAARGNATAARTAFAPLQYIDELAPTDAPSIGVQVPMQRTVNEGQVAAFLDLYDGSASLARTNGPAPVLDPTLVQGKVWMFWTSSRGRVGRAAAPGTLLPAGFDLLYQTLAPNFELASFSGLP